MGARCRTLAAISGHIYVRRQRFIQKSQKDKIYRIIEVPPILKKMGQKAEDILTEVAKEAARKYT
jgi:hypothetical protein